MLVKIPNRGSGAISEETFIDKERQLQRIDSQQLSESQQRGQGLIDEVLDVARQKEEYLRNSLEVSPVA